jgi:N-acetylneuraminic acid mutarotase
MKLAPLCLVALLVVVSLICSFALAGAQTSENSWTAKAPMPTARELMGAAVVNGKIYVIGGEKPSGARDQSLSSNEMYDPDSDTWTTKAPMPTPRDSFGIVAYQNKIYVIGGITRTINEGYRILGVNEVYGPVTDTWEIKTPMPTYRNGMTANVVNGRICIISGQGKQGDVDTNEVYDPTTDSWSTVVPIPTSAYHYESAVIENKIYILSGYNGVTWDTHLSQIYDPATNSWDFGTNIPSAVSDSAIATTGERAPARIYVFGGDQNHVYDPVSKTWTTGTPIPTNRGRFALAVITDIIYVIGGSSNDVGLLQKMSSTLLFLLLLQLLLVQLLLL